jgi:hypothetical protein
VRYRTVFFQDLVMRDIHNRVDSAAWSFLESLQPRIDGHYQCAHGHQRWERAERIRVESPRPEDKGIG